MYIDVYKPLIKQCPNRFIIFLMVLKYMEMRKYIFTEGMKITGDCLILDYLQLPT